MYRSLAILKNLPGNLEREETCETFKNSLLSALRPIVRRDISNSDISPLQEYIYVFKKLGRYAYTVHVYTRAIIIFFYYYMIYCILNIFFNIA